MAYPAQEKPEIKAVVVDVDGTITDMKRRVSIDAIQAIREMPIPVIIATGNVICFVRAAAKLLGASDIMIGENGGVILMAYDAEAMVLGDIERCKDAEKMLEEHFPELHPLDKTYRKSELAFRRNIDLYKANVLIEQHFPDLELVDTKFAIHLKQKKVNKGMAIEKIAELMGLKPENFAAMGDSANDIHMFSVAGVKIAVGNAVPELIESADYVTKEKYGEGGAEGLRWLARQL